jgi:hypothetical protein
MTKNTWRCIEEDLVASGADEASVKSQHDFIKTWVDDVWIGEDDNDENLAP